MSRARSRDLRLRTDSIRGEVLYQQQQLQASRRDIAQALQAVEHLAIQGCTLGLRQSELELDEQSLAESEALAVESKIEAERRLMEVGGYECVVRVLRKELQQAKTELQGVQAETQDIDQEESQMRAELVRLAASLASTQQNVAQLQLQREDEDAGKRDADAKLSQLSSFLQHTLVDTRPASPVALTDDAHAAPPPSSPSSDANA